MKSNTFNHLSKGLIALASTAMLATSCSDDFLKQDPLSFYEPSKTFTTESGVTAALSMGDRLLRGVTVNYSGGSENIPITTEYFFSEMAVYGTTDVGASSFMDDWATKLTPTSFIGGSGNGGASNAIGYFWDQGYLGVKYANQVISNIDGVSGLAQDKKNMYKGQAYFQRAWHYSHLVFQFGDIPLVAKILEVPKQNYKSTKKEAILDMLVSDMEKAVQWVPNQSGLTYIGQVNKGACRTLLAKLYLATGQWKKAELQCDTLINNLDGTDYHLMTESFGTEETTGSPATKGITRNVIWDLHRPQNKLCAENKEVIMGMVNQGESGTGAVGVQWLRIFLPWYDRTLRASSSSKTNDVTNYAIKDNKGNAVKDYDADLDWVRYTGRGLGVCRLTYFSQHPLWKVNGVEDNQDLRHNSEVGNWMRMTDFKYNNPKAGDMYGKNVRLYDDAGNCLCTDTLRGWFDYPYYKLFVYDTKNHALETASNFTETLGSCNNMYLYRLAEVYLLRAEARFFQDNNQGATDDVNEVRKRAKASQLYTSVTIGDIMNERARELYTEEWRNCELKRVSYELAQSGKPDEWGNTYSLDNWDKQDGTDAAGGSYWYQRIMHYSYYNKGAMTTGGRTFNFTMDKHNMYWPIPNSAIKANSQGQLHQNYGYNGYDASIPEWDNWQDAVADEDKTN